MKRYAPTLTCRGWQPQDSGTYIAKPGLLLYGGACAADGLPAHFWVLLRHGEHQVARGLGPLGHAKVWPDLRDGEERVAPAWAWSSMCVPVSAPMCVQPLDETRPPRKALCDCASYLLRQQQLQQASLDEQAHHCRLDVRLLGGKEWHAGHGGGWGIVHWNWQSRARIRLCDGGWKEEGFPKP